MGARCGGGGTCSPVLGLAAGLGAGRGGIPMGGGLAISTVTVRHEAGSDQRCWAPVVIRREQPDGAVGVDNECGRGCRVRSRWSVCWELTMVGVLLAGNDGRRSQKWGAFRGESIPCQCPCHVTSSVNVGGPSSATNAAAGSGSGDGTLVAAALLSSGAGRQGIRQAPDPTFLIKYLPRYRRPYPWSSYRTLPCGLSSVGFLDDFASHHHHHVILFLSLLRYCIYFPSQTSHLERFQDDDPTCEEEHSPPGHQPQLLP